MGLSPGVGEGGQRSTGNMRLLYDLVKPVRDDHATLQATVGLTFVILLLHSLYPRIKEWWECRNFATKTYHTDHSKSPRPDVGPLPYENMPRRAGRSAERLRVVFDNPVYLHQYVAHGHMKLGPVFRDGLGGPVDMVFVADTSCLSAVHRASGSYPGHVVPDAWTLYLKIRDKKRGIFFMDGPEWLEHRRILNQRVLRTSNSNRVLPQLCANTDALMQHMWEEQTQGNLQAKLMVQLYKWSLECMFAIALGRSISSFKCSKEPQCDFDAFVSAIHNVFEHTAGMGRTTATSAMEQNLKVWNDFCEACDVALHVAGRYINEAAEDIKLQDQTAPDADACLLERLMLDDGVSQDMAVRLLSDLFLAAADTSVWTAVWLIYVSASHVSYASAARQELYQVTGRQPADSESPLELGQEQLRRLSRCRHLLKETLRLYPVATFLTRLVEHESVLGGYRVPGNTMIIVSLYSIGRDPKYFSDPDTFDPTRWASETLQDLNTTPKRNSSEDTDVSQCNHESPDCSSKVCEKRHSNPDIEEQPGQSEKVPLTRRSQKNVMSMNKLSALPWGIGTRNCVGRTVAETLLTLFEAQLLCRYHVVVRNKSIHMKMRMISVPSEMLDVVLYKVRDMEETKDGILK
ncbi:cytochrome P450 315a1, mitochondrial [Hyalella azteca]|uniref:Cytochrome P450 315a1, mitochondrial n=1 Tax=Hyalella azteca TaxID=294128 RepID=A0A8B7P3X5_HYAAZ|nr:cytochrome P450 315a1, mitochondrial [Hyalella azteca]